MDLDHWWLFNHTGVWGHDDDPDPKDTLADRVVVGLVLVAVLGLLVFALWPTPAKF